MKNSGKFINFKTQQALLYREKAMHIHESVLLLRDARKEHIRFIEMGINFEKNAEQVVNLNRRERMFLSELEMLHDSALDDAAKHELMLHLKILNPRWRKEKG